VASAEKDADVLAYAPDTLRHAQDALSQMQTELRAKHYDKTKVLAVEAKNAADRSYADAKDGKEKTKAAAAAILDSLSTAFPEAAKNLAAARKVRGIKLDFKALEAALAGAKDSAAAAKTEFDAGRFNMARDKASTAQTSLADLVKQISDAVQAATKKK
jgi:hypothetical protein